MLLEYCVNSAVSAIETQRGGADGVVFGILTSGLAGNALEGAPLIWEHNLTQVIQETGAAEYHLYLTKPVTSGMNCIREGISMGHPDLTEYDYLQVEACRVGQARELLNNFNAKTHDKPV